MAKTTTPTTVTHPGWCDPTLCVALPHPDDPSHFHVGPRDTFTAGDDNTQCELSLYGSHEPFIDVRIDSADGLVLDIGAARDFARRILALADIADPDSRFVAPGIEFVKDWPGELAV